MSDKKAENPLDSEAYKKIIDYLPNADAEHLRRVALETAKSNPEFFIKALSKIGVDVENYSPEKNPVGVSSSNMPSMVAGTITVRAQHTHSHEDYYFSPQEWFGVAEGIAEGKRVHAIKAFRQATGTGLKEAKEAVDNLIVLYSEAELYADNFFTYQT